MVVLDSEDRVIVGSRRARQTIEGPQEGEKIPQGLGRARWGPPRRRPVRRAGPLRAPGRPEPWRRSTAYEEPGRLHGGGLPRAAHAARPARRAPRDRDAPRRGRARPRRPGTNEVEQIRSRPTRCSSERARAGTRVVRGPSPSSRSRGGGGRAEECVSRAGVALAVEGDPGTELAIRRRTMGSWRRTSPRTRSVTRAREPPSRCGRAGGGRCRRPRERRRRGVDERELTRLFERFYRADRACARGHGVRARP